MINTQVTLSGENVEVVKSGTNPISAGLVQLMANQCNIV